MDMGIDGWTGSPSSSASSTYEHNLAAHPKRPAGRTKFKETRHPVYRGVRRRGSAGRWVCEVRVPGKRGERLCARARRRHAPPRPPPSRASTSRTPLGCSPCPRGSPTWPTSGAPPWSLSTSPPPPCPSLRPVHNADRLFEVPTYSALDLGGGDMFELDMSGEIDLDTYYAGLAEGMLLEPPLTPYSENRECGDGDAALWSY